MPLTTLTLDVHRVTGTSAADLRSLVAALEEARDSNRAFELSLACLDERGASHRRLSPSWVRAAGNLLLGEYNALPLRIELPHERSVQLQLMRNAFYSALALHFLVIDNGYGIPRTMRWQHPDALGATDSAAIIECALRKRLFDRGIGGHDGAGMWSLKEPAR